MISGTHRVLVKSWRAEGAMTRQENHNGATVLKIHYSADPAKTNEWADDFAKTLQGRDSWSWLAEMEMQAEAYGGKRIFPEFTRETHTIEPLTEIPAEWPKYRVIDPGLDHALACGFYVLDPHRQEIIKFDEHVQADWPEIERHASVIKGKTAKHQIQTTWMDPSAFAETLAGQGKSVAQLFIANGITCCPAAKTDKLVQIASLANLLMLRGDQPRMKWTKNCEVSIDQMLKYRWLPRLHDDKPSPQKPYKVYDDCVDCDLYLSLGVDPVKASDAWVMRDPLSRWYGGNDRRRIAADTRRMYEAMNRDPANEEP